MAFGYLSVLLSYLCLNGTIRKRVCSRLRGGTLTQLLDTVEEFLQYHRQIDEEIHRNDRGAELDVRAGFIGRLQGVVEGLKQV